MNSQEIYLKLPTPFMTQHWDKLLPAWPIPPQTLVIVLLHSQCPLDEEGELITWEKERLLKQFLQLGASFKFVSKQQGFLTEVISPKDGTPQYSTPGQLIFDLVATVHYSLGLNFYRTKKGCKVLQHPLWQTSVYPGLFLSGTTISEVQSIFSKLVLEYNW